jgi:predicted permease
MLRLKALAARARTIFRRGAAESRVDDEFLFHLEMETQKNVRAGMTPAEAQRRAAIAFGGSDTHREAMRDGRGGRWLEDLWSDARYAVRTLRRSPGFALAAAITLGIGIGANGIVFAMVNGLVLRPVPAAHPEQLVAMYSLDERGGTTHEIAYLDYLDYRDQSGIFNGLAGQTGIPLNLVADRTADMVWGEMVTEDYFSVLAMRPALGQFFTLAEAKLGADPYVVISYESWQKRFAGDAAVVGRTIRVNGSPFIIRGVAPNGFKGMRKFGFIPEMWVPLSMHDVLVPGSVHLLEGRGDGWMIVFGRMRAGATRERTQLETTRFSQQLARSYPATNKSLGTLVIEGGAGFDNPSFLPPQLLVLVPALGMFGAVVILLIVCANLANLLLARAAARRREIAIRLSLGCSRSRLVRQLLAENAILTIPAALLGIAVLFVSPAVQRIMLPQLQFAVGMDVSPDYHVVLYTAGIAILAVLMFGLAPALRATRPALVPALKTAIGQMEGTSRGPGMRGALVVTQLALSVTLLAGGTLFMRSLLAARSVDVGFDARNRIVMSVNPGLQGYDRDRTMAFYRDVVTRVRARPYVLDVSWGFPVPFDTYGRGVALYIEGVSRVAEKPTIGVAASLVDIGFFDAMGIRLAAGRDFNVGDTAGTPRVMIINRAMATRFWPGRDAIGQRARVGSIDGPEITVIGVAADARFASLGADASPYAYRALRQASRGSTDRRDVYGWETLVVHTRGDPLGAMQEIREVVATVDPALPTFGAMTMEQSVSNGLNNARMAAELSGAFAVIALVIAAVGLYAIVANIVTERTREIGVRMALGASSGAVRRLVIGRAGRFCAVGALLGIGGALVVTRLLRSLLNGLSPNDPAAFLVPPLALGAVALLASYLPARRATRVDPIAALRAD